MEDHRQDETIDQTSTEAEIEALKKALDAGSSANPANHLVQSAALHIENRILSLSHLEFVKCNQIQFCDPSRQ